MPVFRYQAVDKRGRNLTGMMPAMDESNLEQRLRHIGLWLTEAALDKVSAPGEAVPESDLRWLKLRGKRRRRELIDFCTLMTFQVRVGIPLAKALEVAAQDCKDPRFQKVLGGLQAQLESGLQFHEALARYPAVFTPHFVSVVRAGELSSKMPETFEDLRKYLEWVEQLMADVRQATLYPSIVLTVVDVRPGRTRLGIEAPAEVAVWREELCPTNLPARETAEQRPPSRKPAIAGPRNNR